MAEQLTATVRTGQPGGARLRDGWARLTRRTPPPPAAGARPGAAPLAPAGTSLEPPDPAGLSEAVAAELAPRLAGPLFVPGDPGYDAERAGYNLGADRRPAVVVGAGGPADVMAAVGVATRHELPVGVINSGHMASVAAGAGILVNVRRMQGVRVDPQARLARIAAGTSWQQVVHEAAAFGLAPLNGSAPAVGAVGYTLGGGLGPLGRAFGYAADHVHSIDIVTAHGALRQVTPQQYGDLFWALRGGKGNFGVVTSMEIGLFPVARLYGGGLYFRGSAAPEVFNAYRRWVRTVPEDLTSSIALNRFSMRPGVPELLRGRFVVHVRIAYPGPAAEGERLVRPLRNVALALADTVADMPYTEVGRIHDDPVGPMAFCERNTYLRGFDEDALDALLEVAGPDSTCPLHLVELRHLGGALGRPPEVPNAVGHRDAGCLLYLAGPAIPGQPAVQEYAEHVLGRVAPWSTGGVCLNFLDARDATPERVRAAFSEVDYRRLVATKRAYDPENIFRDGHNIPPTR